jgi:hypothetical protein
VDEEEFVGVYGYRKAINQQKLDAHPSEMSAIAYCVDLVRA